MEIKVLGPTNVLIVQELLTNLCNFYISMLEYFRKYQDHGDSRKVESKRVSSIKYRRSNSLMDGVICNSKDTSNRITN